MGVRRGADGGLEKRWVMGVNRTEESGERFLWKRQAVRGLRGARRDKYD